MPSRDILGESVKEDENSIARQSDSQKDDSEPKSGVSPDEVPYPQAPDGEAAKETDGSYDWWRNALAALALLVSAIALAVSVASWRTAEKTFYVTHRAAVYLGLPDGKIGQVGAVGKGQAMELYFRNYGPTAAQNVDVEVWPVVTAPVSRAYSEVIPPPRERHYGPSLPPGFPLTIFQKYSGATKEELDLNQKYLHIFGRIRYEDSFSEYCEPFSITYNSVKGIVPFASLNPVLCEDYDETIRAEVETTKDDMTRLYIGPLRYPQEEGPDQRGEK